MGHRVVLYKAYGCTSTKEETIEAWEAGKDFKILGGPYCSIRDYEQLKKDFDIIELKWINDDMQACHHTLHIHILRGLTTYV